MFPTPSKNYKNYNPYNPYSMAKEKIVHLLKLVKKTIKTDKDMEEFFSDNEEYSYIFRNGNWFAYHMHQFEPQVAPEPVEIPSGALAV